METDYTGAVLYNVTVVIPVYAKNAEHAKEQLKPYIRDMRVAGVEIVDAAKVE